MFAGHIKVLGGPHVARGPDVAQAWSIAMIPNRGAAAHKGDMESVGRGVAKYWVFVLFVNAYD